MEARIDQDVEMQDAQQQIQAQIPEETQATQALEPEEDQQQEEPQEDDEDEGEADEGEGEVDEDEDQDQDDQEDDDDDVDDDPDAAPSEDGGASAVSDADFVAKEEKISEKPKGRPRGRPKGSGSKVHRGNGRGPLTLSRRGRGRPRGPNAKPTGPGRMLHEGNIIQGSSTGEGGEGEDGEGDVAQNYGGIIRVGNKEYRLEGDELGLESDEDGDKKIDAKGNLLGGREWKLHAFCSPMRPDPQCVYLLSIDAARAAGYRDSLYFFRKNPLLVKLNLMQGEKDVLIDGGRLSATLRGRNVTMVAARNVFKLHGPRVIKNGRAVTDDYYEAKARAAGKREGEKVGPVDQDDPAAARRELDKQRERARKARDIHLHQSTDHNGETVYTQFTDSGEAPFVRAEGWLLRRQQLARSDITIKNWKLEMAKSVRGINREITEARKGRQEKWLWDWEGGEPLEEDEEKDRETRDIIGKLTGTSKLFPSQDDASSSIPQFNSAGYARRGSSLNPQNHFGSSTPNASKRALEEKEEREAENKRIRFEQAPLGVYDPYTGQIHFPKSLQSERARLVKVSARARYDAPAGSYSSSTMTAPILGGVRVGRAAWGLASFDHYLSDPNPPPFPASREGNVIIPGGEPMPDSDEETTEAGAGPRASVVPGATEEQESRDTPDPNAAVNQNAAHLAANAPQNRVGPVKKLGKAGQGLVSRAALWKAR